MNIEASKSPLRPAWFFVPWLRGWFTSTADVILWLDLNRGKKKLGKPV